jgi:Rieske 2Fe-2S family protein
VAEQLDAWADSNGEPDAFAGYDFTRMKVAARSGWEVEANWKLTVENNLECYHCKLNHPELCRVMDPWGLPARHGSDDTVPSTREIEEIGAQEIRRSGEFDTGYSFDGGPLCSVPLPRLDDRPGPSLFMHITPYNVIAPAGDYVWTWAVDPAGSAHSRVRHMFLVHEEAQAGVDYDPETLPAFWDTVMAQDEPLCANMQRGISQPSYTPGPLNRLHQMFVAGFYHWYQQAMRAHGYDATTAVTSPASTAAA